MEETVGWEDGSRRPWDGKMAMRAGISLYRNLTASPDPRVPSRGYQIWLRPPTYRERRISGPPVTRECCLGPSNRGIRLFGFVRVPADTVWIIERFGKHHRTLYPGFHCLLPIIDRRPLKHALEERTHKFVNIPGVSKDKVDVGISGHLYTKVIDPVLASYSVSDPIYATRVQAETKLLGEIGKITIQELLDEKDAFIDNYVMLLNAAINGWGIECTRLEIKDLGFPGDIPEAKVEVRV